MSEPELRIVRLDDVPWQEVKAQQHGERRVSVWEKYLEWTPERMTLYGRYDPGMLLERPDEAWASVFLGEGFDPEDGAQRVAVLSNSPGAVFAAVRDETGTHAVGVLSLAEGWASLHGMRTRRDRRGQGLAGQVVARLAHAAVERGATKAFLQVETGNAPALALYGRAGFAPLWRYHYWRL